MANAAIMGAVGEADRRRFAPALIIALIGWLTVIGVVPAIADRIASKENPDG